MKKRIGALLSVFLFMALLFLNGCGKNINSITKEPHFKGTVTETDDSSISVRVSEDDNGNWAGKLISVPKKAELKESMTHFAVGDEVTVYYDGRCSTTVLCGSNGSSSLTAVEHVYAIVPVESAEDVP